VTESGEKLKYLERTKANKNCRYLTVKSR